MEKHIIISLSEYEDLIKKSNLECVLWTKYCRISCKNINDEFKSVLQKAVEELSKELCDKDKEVQRLKTRTIIQRILNK